MNKTVNIVIVFSQDQKKVLMCYRTKNPYLGLYNFLGGKKEGQESDFDAAYRELFEESGITRNDINLSYLFATRYFEDDIELQVFYGVLKHDVKLVPEKHPLHWIELEGTNFADDSKFAGQGNIKHMVEIIKESKQRKGLIE